MNTQHNIEERLWNYIDNVSSTEEKSVIEELLQSNAEWKTKYNKYLRYVFLFFNSFIYIKIINYVFL